MNGLTLHNTLARRKEPLQTIEPEHVRMYVCGPNLYAPAHIGHAFSYAFFDVLRRYLEYRGYRVTHVQNFTDIEDRIIERSLAEGRGVPEIAGEYIARFYREMDALGVRRAHHYPRASEVIPTIVKMVSGLIARGHAYVVDGDVYFRVASFPRYLALSHRSLEEMQAGARVEIDPRKEHPMDFALWKHSRPGEPAWESPWGGGRPGWHIECSAMSLQYLGEQIDIHGGGEDVIFPHHENEIAQSESYTGKTPFVRFWLHNALMKPPSGDEKMTRHLGNIVSIADALQRHDPDALRLYFVSTHYRTPLRWAEDAVQAAGRGVERLRTALRNAEDAVARAGDDGDGGLDAAIEHARSTFDAAMDDDLNTPGGVAALFTLAGEINKVADGLLKGEGEGRAGLIRSVAALRELSGVLGLSLRPRLPTGLLDGLRALLDQVRVAHRELFDAEQPTDDPAAIIEALLEGRGRARERQAYAVADRIRAGLNALGVIVEDLPGGARWRLAPRSDDGAR